MEKVYQDVYDANGVLICTKEALLAYAQAEEESRRLNLIENSIIKEVNKRIDIFVKAKKYDSVEKLLARAGYEGPFQADGLYGALKIDETWVNLIKIFDQVKIGIRPHPESFAEIESELPALIWE
jgi:hypothetical protein